MLSFMLTAGFCYAQTGNNAISIGAEADFPLGSYTGYNIGFGGNVKGLYGLGASGQLTLTAGYSSFSGKSGSLYNGQTLSLLPILAGYRYNLASGLYGEGQVGLATLTTRIPGFSFSQTNFAAAANVGYVFNNFDVSVRYYTEGDVMSMFAVRLAYNIALGGKK